MIAPSGTYSYDDVQMNSSYRSSISSLVSPNKEEFVEDASNENKVDISYYGRVREDIVKVALNEVGTYEIGGNTNNIKYNDWYQPSHPWLTGRDEYCAIFVLWCLNQVGMYKEGSTYSPSIDSASCISMANQYMKYDRFVYASSNYKPRPGDIVFFTKWVPNNSNVGYHSNHVGIVVSSDDTYVYTVEGNTSIPSTEFQRSGNGVYSKKHIRVGGSDECLILGYGIPWYQGDEEFSAPGGIIYNA